MENYIDNIITNTTFKFDIKVAAGLSPTHKTAFMVMNNLDYDLMMQKEGFINLFYDYENANSNIEYLLEFVQPLLDNIHSSIKDITYNLIMIKEEDLNVLLQIFYNSIMLEVHKFNARRVSAIHGESKFTYNSDVDSIIFRYFYMNLDDWCLEQRNKDIKEVVRIGCQDEHYNGIKEYIGYLNFKKIA